MDLVDGMDTVDKVDIEAIISAISIRSTLSPLSILSISSNDGGPLWLPFVWNFQVAAACSAKEQPTCRRAIATYKAVSSKRRIE